MSTEELKIYNKGSHILVEFVGEFSMDLAMQCIDKMLLACETYNCSKVLLNCTEMIGTPQFMDRFKVAEYGANKGRSRMKVALLNREEIMTYGSIVEDTAVNRGLDMKGFTNLEEAELWLSE